MWALTCNPITWEAINLRPVWATGRFYLDEDDGDDVDNDDEEEKVEDDNDDILDC